VNVSIPIRPDYTVCVSVPDDLTGREAWAISCALQSATQKPPTKAEIEATDAARESIAKTFKR
jgi:hypothetical protein